MGCWIGLFKRWKISQAQTQTTNPYIGFRRLSLSPSLTVSLVSSTMAILSRSLPKTLSFLSRSLSASTTTTATTFATATSSRSTLSLFRPLAAASVAIRRISPASSALRGLATRATSSSLNDPNPNWSNRPPKETILLDGCDFEHWLVVVEKPEGDPTRDEIIDSYIKTLAKVVGR